MDRIALLKSALMLFAIVNPLGSLPLFLHLTGGMTRPERSRAFRTGVLASAIILFVFILAGQQVLTYFFRIELCDLMAAGGLLLLIIAIDHLVFGSLLRRVSAREEETPDHIGAVPIGCPILAGPGAMMTILIIFSEHGFLIAASSVVLVLGVTWLILLFIDTIYRVLGKVVCTVLYKILSLFIAAIGIRFLMQGLSAYFQKS